jgi:hypothetical protein
MFTNSISLKLGALLLTCASLVHGHLQMYTPFALHSKFDPKNGEGKIDYSMTGSLAKGGPYPCKGYIDDSMHSVATWKAGESVDVVLAGTAIHGGGSCQFSMSYDKGATWNVILSYIGGCILDADSTKKEIQFKGLPYTLRTMPVDIPAEAPPGEALFAWTWFNYEGEPFESLPTSSRKVASLRGSLSFFLR